MDEPRKPSWILIIIISLLLAGLIAAGFVIALLWQLATAGQNTIFSPNPTSSTSVQVTTDFSDVNFSDTVSGTLDDSGIVAPTDAVNPVTDNSAWTEFTSQTIPLRFSYPSTWQLFEGSTTTSEDIQVGDYDLNTAPASDNAIPPGHELEITLIPEPTGGATLEDWIKQGDEAYLGKVGDITDIIVDSLAAKLDTMSLGYAIAQTVVIPLNDDSGQMIALSLYGPETEAVSARPLLDSILATVHISKP